MGPGVVDKEAKKFLECEIGLVFYSLKHGVSEFVTNRLFYYIISIVIN